MKFRKIFLLLAGLSLIFTFSPKKASAQSPIRCGLINEPCCNFAGSKPNSCRTGLVCEGGKCIPLDPDNISPDMYRGAESVKDVVPAAPLSDLEGVFGRVVSVILGFGGVVLFLMLVAGGFQFITASGDPAKVEQTKKTLTYAIAGIAFLALAFLILRFISLFTGVDVTQFKIFQGN